MKNLFAMLTTAMLIFNAGTLYAAFEDIGCSQFPADLPECLIA